MKLSKRIKQTLSGLKSSRKCVKKCQGTEPEPCKETSETIKTSLYEILLTHPDFSWIVTETDVRANISIRARDKALFIHSAWWDESLKMTDQQNVHINITQREKCEQ